MKQQSQTSYMRGSGEVMTPPILYTIKETFFTTVRLKYYGFRYHQEKHSCTLTSVEKIQINMLMKGKQLTTQPSEQSCNLGINSCVSWHINLSSAHAHHCLKKREPIIVSVISQEHSLSHLQFSEAKLIPHTRDCSGKTVPHSSEGS